MLGIPNGIWDGIRILEVSQIGNQDSGNFPDWESGNSQISQIWEIRTSQILEILGIWVPKLPRDLEKVFQIFLINEHME